MGVSVVFEGGSDAVEVVPGEEAVQVLRVENTGMVVDRIVVDVLGDAAEWTYIEPAQINLLPASVEHVRVAFRPPRAASTAPGEVPYGLRVMSTEDPEGSTIEEGVVRVGEFGELGARLVARSATGRRSAKFRLLVENHGNRPEDVRVEPLDPDAKLGFKTRPAAFVAQPGTATFVRLKTVPRKTFFRGPNKTLPFEVSAMPEQGAVATADGVMVERQTLPEWLFPTLGVLAVLCGLALALWFTVLRPVVHSAATAESNASSAAAQASRAAGSASSAAKNAANSAKSGAAPTSLTVKLASSAVLTGSMDLATATGTTSTGAAATPNLVWTTSNPAVATVSQKGVVSAVSPGTATITATSAGNQTATPTAGSGPSAAAESLTPNANGAAFPLDDPTPTASGTLTATPGPSTLTATPGTSTSVVSASVTVNVVGPVSVSTVALPQGVLGKTYSESLGGAGGTGSFTWSVSQGSLPPGFTLSPDGVLSGTPNTVGTTTFKVQLANAGPPSQFAAKTFSLAIVDAPSVDTSSLPGATVGGLYTQTLTAVFGTAPYTWSLVPGQGVLPPGIVLNSTTGVISGTPTTTGEYAFSVQVTDSAKPNQSATQQLTISVADQLTIGTPAKLPIEGVKNAPYALTMNAFGGTQPYTWSVSSGSLPLGLTLNATSGVLSGTPTVSAASVFTVQVVSAGPPAQTASEQVTLTVVTAPTVATSSLPGAVTGQVYPKQTLSGDFGTGPYTWSIVPGQGAPPGGLTLTPSTGVISGTPLANEVGTYNFTVELTDSTKPAQTATQHLSIAVSNPLTPTTPTTLPADGVVNAPYSVALSAIGGTQPYTWSVANGSTLPPGLTLNSTSGVLSGTPSVAGKSTFTVDLTDSSSPAQPTSETITLTVVTAPAVDTSSLPGGVTGQLYPQQTLAGKFGTPGYTWALVPGQGALPGGLGLSPGGVISGTPAATAVGTFAFTVQLTDSSSPPLTATQRLSITVANPLSVSTLQLPGGVVRTAYSQSLVAAGGTQPYTWAWAVSGTGTLPPGLSLNATTGVISGTPTKDGQYTFVVTATDSGNPDQTASSQILSLTVVDPLVDTSSSLPPGALNLAYSTQLTATGGSGTYAWTLTGTLPTGVTLASNGVLGGTPTQTGVFPFTVQTTDDSSPPLTTTDSLSLTVVGSLQVTTKTLPDVLAGQPYSQTLTASGGVGPYTWSLQTGSTLPTGLTLDPVKGVVSGTTTAATGANPAPTTFVVTDTGPPQQTASQDLKVVVTQALSFSLPQTPDAVTGGSYDLLPVSPSGGSGSFVWSESGALPKNLTFSTSTGEINGTVATDAVAGVYPIELTMADKAGGVPPLTDKLSITVVKPLTVPGSYNWTGGFGTALHQSVQPSNGEAPYTFAFAATDTLPPWLSIDSATGAVTGTPDIQCSSTMGGGSAPSEQFTCPPATYNEAVTVTDQLGETLTTTINLTVSATPLNVSFSGTATQTTGVPFQFSVGSPSGGYGGNTYQYTATGLPCSADGTVCDQINSSTGVVSGTLANFGKSSYTISVTITQVDPIVGSGNTFVATYQETINTASLTTSTPTTTTSPTG